MLMEEVSKQGEDFRERRVGRGSYFPFLLSFILLLIIVS
jgi:hypothetical protein